MSDYDRIAEVIRYLDKHQQEQPDLETLASHIGLSSSHFHRLFSSWAGITPKDFLQSLTLAHAKESLLAGNSVLDSALEAGLSGPGRLHDLCVSLKAATPGEIKSGGAGWTVSAGYAETPFGTALIAESPRGLCHLSFVENCRSEMVGDLSAATALQRHWPKAEVVRDDQRAEELCKMVFVERRPPCRLGPAGIRTGQSPSLQPRKLFVKGTTFQVQVWQALLQIPAGKFSSYGHLADFIGKPKASRAVGTAIGNNPIAYLIPCHRVIRETGAIGGYRWGKIRKKVIQAWESSKKGQIPSNH